MGFVKNLIYEGFSTVLSRDNKNVIHGRNRFLFRYGIWIVNAVGDFIGGSLTHKLRIRKL